MEIRISLKKGRKLIASEVISNPRQGDLTVAIGRVIADARKLLDAPAWDCQIVVRKVSKSKPHRTRAK
jgi:hypothetical protein